MSHYDPFKRFSSTPEGLVPDNAPAQFGVMDPVRQLFTRWRAGDPGRSRDVVYQPFQPTNITVGTTPVALGTQNQIVDAMIISLLSSAANSVFIGKDSSVTTSNGFPIEAGTSIGIGTDNQSQMYEIRAAIENLTALIAATFASSVPPPESLAAPRLVFRLSDFYLVAAANTTVNLMFFFPPEKGA